MATKDVWYPARKCPSCGGTEYDRYTEDDEWGVSQQVAGRKCDGGCTADQVAEAQERHGTER
ncbi:hypothetical protein ACFCZV_13195 [Streptomyces hydrogenans]|uniref:hypothetical protein n=1 Tax=Streptomyces hydrogenans TaxID=1873719 RepID=UPI0035D98F2C